MATKVLFFASLREALGTGAEDVSLPADVTTVGDLRDHLVARGGTWSALAPGRSLRMAVNQRLVDGDAAIHEGDEVAFFPPVTGG